MSFSYLCKIKLDELDLEDFIEGDAVHLRRKSTQETFSLKEETRLFMELYEKYGISWRAQYQHKGFWGTNLRNDADENGKIRRFNRWDLPQGVGDYEWNKSNGREPSEDPWPRMYTKEWLEA